MNDTTIVARDVNTLMETILFPIPLDQAWIPSAAASGARPQAKHVRRRWPGVEAGERPGRPPRAPAT